MRIWLSMAIHMKRRCVALNRVVRGGILIVLAACAGCATSTPPPSNANAAASPQSRTLAMLVTGEGGEQEFESRVLDAPGVLRVRREAGPATTAGLRTWIVTREVEATSEGSVDAKHPNRRVQTWVELADGSIALSHEENHEEQVIVDFEPPMVIYPASLTRVGGSRASSAPGEARATGASVGSDAPAGFTQKTFVTVHPMERPDKVRVKGPATQQIWYEGDETPPGAAVPGADQAAGGGVGSVASPAVPAARVRSRCEIDFGVSRSVNESIVWISESIGVMHEWRSERAFALAVRGRDKTEEWARRAGVK